MNQGITRHKQVLYHSQDYYAIEWVLRTTVSCDNKLSVENKSSACPLDNTDTRKTEYPILFVTTLISLEVFGSWTWDWEGQKYEENLRFKNTHRRFNFMKLNYPCWTFDELNNIYRRNRCRNRPFSSKFNRFHLPPLHNSPIDSFQPPKTYQFYYETYRLSVRHLFVYLFCISPAVHTFSKRIVLINIMKKIEQHIQSPGVFLHIHAYLYTEAVVFKLLFNLIGKLSIKDIKIFYH